MGEKDLAHNDYFSDRHRFADVCNGILFQGREVIRPEELEEAEQDIIYMSDDGRHKIIPDKVRIWNGVVCLYDMLNISEELNPYITNYKMNLFDYHNYDDFSFFKTENRELFEVLSCARSETKMKSLLYGNEDRYRRLPGNAAETIFDIAGINRKLLEKIFDNGKEVVDM